MKLTWDPRYNIAYITFREKTEQVETVQVGEDVNAAVGPDVHVHVFADLHGLDLLRLLPEGDVRDVVARIPGQLHCSVSLRRKYFTITVMTSQPFASGTAYTKIWRLR